MENVIDIRMTLEQLGTGWQFGGSVTAGTPEAWNAVVWEDTRDKPTWDMLNDAHITASLSKSLVDIETKYEPQLAAMRNAVASTQLSDGENMNDRILALSTEWKALTAKKSNEINTLLLGV